MGFEVEKWLSNLDTFKHLVSKGFRIMDDLSTSERHALLGKVFKDKNIQCLDELMENGLEIDIREEVSHRTRVHPLTLALRSITDEDTYILEYLIKKGCPVKGPTCRDRYRYYGDDPLVVAVKQNLPKAVECLLKHGADVDKPVLEAIGDSLNPSMVKILLDFNIDLNQKNGIILHTAIRQPHRYGSQTQQCQLLKMVEILLESGADPNIKTERGYTAGHTLMDTNNISEDDKCVIFGLLLKFGLELEERTGEGQTPLMLSARQQSEQTTKCLVEAGANVNVTDNMGNSPLLLVVLNCYNDANHELVVYLIANNADVNARNNAGLSSLDHLLICHRRCEKTFIFLLSSTEVKLPEEDKIQLHKPYSWLLMSRLIQAGCSRPVVLDGVLGKTIEECNSNGHQLIVHSDPTFFGQDSDQQDFNHILMDECPSRKYMADNRCVTSLKTWSVYHLRHHLLDVTGNKSIILRLKQLPLPQTLLSLVTLDCFTVDPPPIQVQSAISLNNGTVLISLLHSMTDAYDSDY